MKTPTTCLEMSIENISKAEVGSESWRHKWRCLDSEDSDNLPGDKQREIGKIGRLKLGVGPGDTSEVFGQ